MDVTPSSRVDKGPIGRMRGEYVARRRMAAEIWTSRLKTNDGPAPRAAALVGDTNARSGERVAMVLATLPMAQ